MTWIPYALAPLSALVGFVIGSRFGSRYASRLALRVYEGR